MIGQVTSAKDGTPIKDVAVRLAQVYRQVTQGAFVLDTSHSPGNYTDSNGKFFIQNFDAGEYLIVVGEPEDNNYTIVQGQDGKPLTFTVEAGKTFDAGVLKTDYTP